ncbi:UNVERIFIED_CONTAM: hypothetical protein FKN15_018247 [Acipenser sinensis]
MLSLAVLALFVPLVSGHLGADPSLDNAWKLWKDYHQKQYMRKEGKCRYNVSGWAATCSGYKILPRGDEAALQYTVARVGPVAVGIDATRFSFHHYRGGLYYEPSCSSQKLNHAVLVVGYGTENGHDYWIVKNSWGISWGENGYVRMARNRDNNCGIATYSIVPKL